MPRELKPCGTNGILDWAPRHRRQPATPAPSRQQDTDTTTDNHQGA